MVDQSKQHEHVNSVDVVQSPAVPNRAAPRIFGKRIVEVPTIIQMEAAECGAACLASVLAHYGRHITLEESRRVCGVSRDGSNALQLSTAAGSFGLGCEGFSVEVEELRTLKLPGILFWGFDHFVVLEGWKNGRWRIMDPAVGQRWVSATEFDEKFTGVVLELQPTERFRPGGSPRSLSHALMERMHGSWRVIVAAALCGLLISAPAFALPALGAVFVDRVLLEGAGRWILPMVFMVLAAMTMSAGLTFVQQRLLAKLEQRMAISGATGFFEHVLRLPVDFFSHRYAGDLVQRLTSIEMFADLLAAKLAPAIVGLITSIIFLGAMFAIDKPLALFAVLVIGVVLLLVIRSGRALTDHTRTLERDIGLGAGALSSGLAAIETIKSSGRESDLFARVAAANAKVATSQQILEGLATTLTAVPEFLVSLLVSAVVLSFGGWQVMKGDITLGSLLAFQAILLVAMGPILDLAALGQDIQSLRATLSRVDDVLRHPLDPLTQVQSSISTESRAAETDACADALEFRNVVFGYSESLEPIVRGLSLKIAPGRRVALVGLTGSGKSTVAKLACGLCLPWSGEVLLDGRPITTIPRHERTSLMAVVGQAPCLFEASLRENLSMWDPHLPDEWMQDAAVDAGLSSLLDDRGGLSFRIAEHGSNLSGGEAQRIEIARALTRRPSILILDEATSSLDATTESQLDRAIRRRGCACLVIAHRLSTIRDADEIVVLDHGVVSERGSHEELLARNGVYASFVQGGGQG